jgi:hypothetical protein
MPGEFDPLRAAREELESLGSISRVIAERVRAAEQRAGEAEAEMMAYRKLDGFMRIQLERQRAVIDNLSEGQ